MHESHELCSFSSNQNEIKKKQKQIKDSHSFMTTIKYKKIKVNHGGEV
jgi:hypothetical protein